eukprot:m.377878 g.377878  ORF g.377878 m.377878 type:complete len:93 (-) comp56193_c0_seq11:191-469(-)
MERLLWIWLARRTRPKLPVFWKRRLAAQQIIKPARREAVQVDPVPVSPEFRAEPESPVVLDQFSASVGETNGSCQEETLVLDSMESVPSARM